MTGSVVFARKAGGTCRPCQAYRGLKAGNAISRPSVEPPPRVYRLVDETCGARFSTTLNLAAAYMQFRITRI